MEIYDILISRIYNKNVRHHGLHKHLSSFSFYVNMIKNCYHLLNTVSDIVLGALQYCLYYISFFFGHAAGLARSIQGRTRNSDKGSGWRLLGEPHSRCTAHTHICKSGSPGSQAWLCQGFAVCLQEGQSHFQPIYNPGMQYMVSSDPASVSSETPWTLRCLLRARLPGLWPLDARQRPLQGSPLWAAPLSISPCS